MEYAPLLFLEATQGCSKSRYKYVIGALFTALDQTDEASRLLSETNSSLSQPEEDKGLPVSVLCFGHLCHELRDNGMKTSTLLADARIKNRYQIVLKEGPENSLAVYILGIGPTIVKVN